MIKIVSSIFLLSEIITFEGSFHGRSSAGIAAAGSAKLTKGFGPLLGGFRQVPFGQHEPLNEAVNEKTAAVMIEPIQGEGGIRQVPDQCLKGLRDFCDSHGTVSYTHLTLPTILLV